MDAEEVRQYFKGGIDCSQVVLGQYAEELGYDKEEAFRIASAFGGGMFYGSTCGAVSGALIALGMRYGHYEMNDAEQKEKLLGKVKEFLQRFTQSCSSTICRELCGFDFSKDGELQRAMESGLLMKNCPHYVQTSLEILKDLMPE